MKPALAALLALLAALFLPAIAAVAQCPGPCPYHAALTPPPPVTIHAAAYELIATPTPAPSPQPPAPSFRRRPVLRVVTAPARFLLHRQPLRRTVRFFATHKPIRRAALAPVRFLVRHRPGLIVPRRF